MGVVNYIGLKSLDAEEADVVRSIVESHIDKVKRNLPDVDMVGHVKLHEVQGRKKYSLHCRIDDPHVDFVTDAVDWDLRKSAHMLMEKLDNAIKKKLRVGGQKQERFRPRGATRGKDASLKAKVRGLTQ